MSEVSIRLMGAVVVKGVPLWEPLLEMERCDYSAHEMDQGVV